MAFSPSYAVSYQDRSFFTALGRQSNKKKTANVIERCRIFCFPGRFHPPRLYAVCRRYRKINPLSLTAVDLGTGRGGWEIYVCPISGTGGWAHACMSAVALTHAVHSKKRDHHNGGVATRTRACTAYMKGTEGLKGDALRLIWLKGGLWRGGVGGGLRLRSMKVLSFNMSRMWEAPTGLWKSAKSCCQGCSRWEIPHSPFYYTVTRWRRLKWCERTRARSTVIHQLSPNGSSYNP